LRPGFVRVAGVTTEGIRDELVRLMRDRGLRSLSQALGVALAEWSVWRGEGVLHPGEPLRGNRPAAETGRVLNPATEWAVTLVGPRVRFVSIRPLKDLVLGQFPEGHPLREVILAERDTLTRDELVAKLETWLVLFSRKS